MLICSELPAIHIQHSNTANTEVCAHFERCEVKVTLTFSAGRALRYTGGTLCASSSAIKINSHLDESVLSSDDQENFFMPFSTRKPYKLGVRIVCTIGCRNGTVTKPLGFLRHSITSLPFPKPRFQTHYLEISDS